MEGEYEVISKVEAALIQLEDAIQLFYSERYISAITLAGAAEEIFGRLCSELLGGKTRFDMADINASMLAMFDHDHVYLDSLGEQKKEELLSNSRKEHLKEHSRVRNELKHKSNPDEDFSFADSFKVVARTHIANTISNIIISRKELPYRATQIDKFCNTEGLSNPYLNTVNWPCEA